MELQPHQIRVVDEKTELDAKISALGKFFDTDTYRKLDLQQMLLLKLQHSHMEAYSKILGARIASF